MLEAGLTEIQDRGAPQIENPECFRPASHISKCAGWLEHPEGQEARKRRLDEGRCGAYGGAATPQRRAAAAGGAACQARPPPPGRTRQGPTAAKGAHGAPSAAAGGGRWGGAGGARGRRARRGAAGGSPRGSRSAQPRSNLAARGKFRGRERCAGARWPLPGRGGRGAGRLARGGATGGARPRPRQRRRPAPRFHAGPRSRVAAGAGKAERKRSRTAAPGWARGAGSGRSPGGGEARGLLAPLGQRPPPALPLAAFP